MTEQTYHADAQQKLDLMKKGAFLTTAFGGKVNTMVIGWGSIGYMWRLPIFTALVRQNRFTHGLLEKTGQFTVTFPTQDLPEALQICGTKSGRNMDKLAACGLTAAPARKIETPRLDVPGYHYECKVLYKTTMSAQDLDKAIKELWYEKEPGDYHTLYFGEILDSYQTH